MATGGNIQPGRGMVLTDATPGIDFRTGKAEMWGEAGRVFKKYEEAQRPNLIRRARERGAAEGVAVAEGGPMPKRGPLFFGDVAEARQAALEEAYRARIKTDIDKREAEIRAEFSLDPEGYEREAGRMRSGFIQGAPPEFAVDVENYAVSLTQRGQEVVAQARVSRDNQEINQALTVRAAKLQEDLIAMAARGDTESLDYLQAEAEYVSVQDQRMSNPAILYSEDQRLADDEKLDDAMMVSVVNRDAIGQYDAAGRGLPGFAAAARYLDENLLNGEAFADIPAGRRAKMHRDAMAELRAFSAADREEARLADEQERERRREMREIADSLVLDASLGGVSDAEILARDDLDAASKSRILSANRARISRERTAASAARNEARLGQVEAYNALRDGAEAGALSEAEIAEALNADQITPGQAQTLRTRRDRTLAPLVDDVMSPVRDAANRPGASVMPDRNQRMARAEEGAARWVRDNPNATLEQRLQAGRWYAERHFGANANRPATGGGGNGGEAQARAARIREVNARIAARARAGRPYSTAEANRMRSEAQQGPVNGD